MFPDNESMNERIGLSEQGLQRRLRILQELKVEVATRAQRRKTSRSVVRVLMLIVLGGGLWWANSALLNSPADVRRADLEKPIDPYSLDSALVSNQPDVIDKYVVNNADFKLLSESVKSVSDESLQKMLADSGKNIFVARVENRLVLWQQDPPATNISN